MSDVRGYDEQSHQRIAAGIRKIERLNVPMGGDAHHKPQQFSVRRVKLEGDLAADAATTGIIRLQLEDLSDWTDTDTILGEIYLGNPELDGMGEDDEVWIIPLQGKWFAIADANTTTDDGSAGCCGPCVDRRFMTVFGNFAHQYRVASLPTSVGGPVTLTYIGLTPSGGGAFPGVTPDDPYWESDTYDVTCDAGTETYFWRMVVGASSPCRAGGGSDNVWLYLVKDGTATLCAFDEWKCASLTEDPVRQYLNIEDFRARCGSKLYLHWPQGLNEELEDVLPCTVCVEPYDPTTAITSACLEALSVTRGRTASWPSLLFVEMTATTVSGLTATGGGILSWQAGPSEWNYTDFGALVLSGPHCVYTGGGLECDASSAKLTVQCNGSNLRAAIDSQAWTNAGCPTPSGSQGANWTLNEGCSLGTATNNWETLTISNWNAVDATVVANMYCNGPSDCLGTNKIGTVTFRIYE